MRFVTTRRMAPPVSFKTALFDGLAPDGGLYVPETIEPWTSAELARLPSRTLTEIAMRALRPYTRGELDATVFEAVIAAALDFPIPLVEVEPNVHALELFHGPTLAFKDVGARVMARLMASLHTGDAALTVLAATSGDTGSAVAHAFHGVPYTRVVVLYPDGRISPTQEAQLTMFNDEKDGNVRAYAVAGSFDDCHRLTREAFGDAALRARVPLTSANSVNVGRLLPQMVYYFHAFAQVRRSEVIFCTPSGNFGNLTAGLMAKRAGLAVDHFIAATNVNDVVPAYLSSGRFEPRPSVRTLANAMDVGNPSNFERMQWLYDGNADAMRRDISGTVHTDAEVEETIRHVYESRGYLLDPHSAIAYRGLVGSSTKALDKHGAPAFADGFGGSAEARSASEGGKALAGRQALDSRSAKALAERQAGRAGKAGIFLATAHPAKFAEIVEPIIGRPIEKPAALADALARRRQILRLEASYDAVRDRLNSAI